MQVVDGARVQLDRAGVDPLHDVGPVVRDEVGVPVHVTGGRQQDGVPAGERREVGDHALDVVAGLEQDQPTYVAQVGPAAGDAGRQLAVRHGAGLGEQRVVVLASAQERHRHRRVGDHRAAAWGKASTAPETRRQTAAPGMGTPPAGTRAMTTASLPSIRARTVASWPK